MFKVELDRVIHWLVMVLAWAVLYHYITANKQSHLKRGCFFVYWMRFLLPEKFPSEFIQKYLWEKAFPYPGRYDFQGISMKFENTMYDYNEPLKK